MLNVVEKPLTDHRDMVLATALPRLKTSSNETVNDEDDGLLATAGPLMAGTFAVALGIVALTFMTSGEALFVVAISGGFAIVFFTLPWLMLRERAKHDERWVRSEAARTAPIVVTFTGGIRRGEALIQMVVVPFAVVTASTAFALIWILVRP